MTGSELESLTCSQTLVYLEMACKVLGTVLGHGGDVLDYGL